MQLGYSAMRVSEAVSPGGLGDARIEAGAIVNHSEREITLLDLDRDPGRAGARWPRP